MNAEHRLVARIGPVEMAWAAFAVVTLALFRERSQDFWRIHLVKLPNYEAVGNCLFQGFEDFGVDGPDNDATRVAFERDGLSVRFLNDRPIESAPLARWGTTGKWRGSDGTIS